MPSCDLCGSTGDLFKVRIEEVTLTVCIRCSALGTIIGKPEQQRHPQKRNQEMRKQEQEITIILGDYPSQIRKAREKLNLSQQELAQKINEKESVLAHLENGTMRPSIYLTRKLEHLLSIRLIETTPATNTPSPTPKEETRNDLTLGDVITIRQRKR